MSRYGQIGERRRVGEPRAAQHSSVKPIHWVACGRSSDPPSARWSSFGHPIRDETCQWLSDKSILSQPCDFDMSYLKVNDREWHMQYAIRNPNSSDAIVLLLPGTPTKLGFDLCSTDNSASQFPEACIQQSNEPTHNSRRLDSIYLQPISSWYVLPSRRATTDHRSPISQTATTA